MRRQDFIAFLGGFASAWPAVTSIASSVGTPVCVNTRKSQAYATSHPKVPRLDHSDGLLFISLPVMIG
jgi:hypothetical protein